MAEFQAFHGMICSPASAQKCVDYFDGAALFASQRDYENKDLSSLDFMRTPIQLNLWTYYALVLFSGTGILSLLGKTKATLIQEENVQWTPEMKIDPVIQSKCLHKIPDTESLTIPLHVIRYIVDRSHHLNDQQETVSNEVHFIRRFEFEFGTLLSVLMCHLECNGRRFLVEVFAFHDLNNPATRVVSFLMTAAQTLLSVLTRRIGKTKQQ